MSLLLCRQERVKHPFYIENLGLHIYSSQELCYMIYHHPLLGLDGFLDSALLEFLRNELDLGFTALKIERWLKSGENPDEALVILLQECDYYSLTEINRFRRTVSALRKLPPAEFAKEKADFLFGLKQYGKAINIYRDILEVGEETPRLQMETWKGGGSRVQEEFLGRVWYNLGAAYARVFRFDRACEALEQAYEFLKEQRVMEKLYHLTRLDPGISIHEKYRAMISEEERAKWEEKFEEARILAEHSGELEELDELFAKDSIKRMEGADRLVKQWKREYRSMA